MRIIREAKYQRRLKEAFELGLTTSVGCGLKYLMYQRAKETNKGFILPGYDVHEEANRILDHKRFD